jgi:membrane-bound serine protease (ClpP class)
MDWIITWFVAGAVLLALETILPGMIAGLLGLLCLGAGVAQSFLLFGWQTGSYILAAVVVILIAGTAFWLKYFPKTPLARLFTSQSTVGDINAVRPELLHQTGSALTTLRPSGTAIIHGQRVDVVTEGEMIDRDTPVQVVAIEGMRVVVRALSETSVPTIN